VIVGFIDEYRQIFGVESICRALSTHGIQIAPRSYRKARRRRPSARDVADASVENGLRDLRGTPEEVYGRRKPVRPTSSAIAAGPDCCLAAFGADDHHARRPGAVSLSSAGTLETVAAGSPARRKYSSGAQCGRPTKTGSERDGLDRPQRRPLARSERPPGRQA
jgi:hypothetical protein